jgi:hypothetical protein
MCARDMGVCDPAGIRSLPSSVARAIWRCPYTLAAALAAYAERLGLA